MDGFEPLTSTVNALFELTTVNTVNRMHNLMISNDEGINGTVNF